MITVERMVDFSRARRGRKQIHGGRDRAKQMQKGAGAPAISTGRVPRVSRLMALAIRFDQLIRDGVVKNQAELGRLGQVSRTRLTQIMNLLNLTPDTQEQILFMPEVSRGLAAPHSRNVKSDRLPRWPIGMSNVAFGGGCAAALIHDRCHEVSATLECFNRAYDIFKYTARLYPCERFDPPVARRTASLGAKATG